MHSGGGVDASVERRARRAAPRPLTDPVRSRWRRFLGGFPWRRRAGVGRQGGTGPARPLAPAAALDLRHRPERFINRELSWVQFNARVLALAGDPRVPLLERAKFLAIFASNLDEFFQVRVAGLKDQHFAGVGRLSHDGRSPAAQLTSIREGVQALCREHEALFRDMLVPALRAEG
ncbi:MAG: hypothetical protein ACLGG9_11535, partial [Thermoleophilia bacterium]